MFMVFSNNVKVKEFKTFGGARKWARKSNLELSMVSIAEMGSEYWSDRIVRLWKWNDKVHKFARANANE